VSLFGKRAKDVCGVTCAMIVTLTALHTVLFTTSRLLLSITALFREPKAREDLQLDYFSTTTHGGLFSLHYLSNNPPKRSVPS
jgi:hypothetical protein